MYNYQVGLDALILAWAFIFTTLCVYRTRSEGSGDAVHMHSRLWALVGQIFDKHKYLMC